MNEIEKRVEEIIKKHKYSLSYESFQVELTDYITGLLDKVVPEIIKNCEVCSSNESLGFNFCVDTVKQNIAKLKGDINGN